MNTSADFMVSREIFSERHIEGTAELERLCFSSPWSADALTLLTREGGLGIAVCEGDAVLAYGGMLCVLDEGQITNIATHPNFRHRGYASMVLQELCAEAEKRGIKNIFLEVRCSNSAAIELYLKYGFECTGVRRGFYSSPREDAYVMQKTL